MANHKSAEKRARQSVKRHDRNRADKTKVKNAVKEVRANVESKNLDQAGLSLKQAMKTIFAMGSKGVIHPRTAARKVSRLSRLLHKASSAPSA